MKKTKIYWLFLLPSLLGVLLFYAIPFAFSLYYALVDNMGSQQFVGLRNFVDTLTNSLFQSAACNAIIFIVLSVPLSMALSLFLSLNMQKLSSAAYILFLVIGVVLLIVFYAQKRVTDAYQ